jgi:hypothetical protein
MSNIGKNPADQTGESQIRGRDLAGSERDQAADHVDYAKRRKSDDVIRTDGEKDTLYEDGIELDDDSDPLTGINGADDTQRSHE